MPDNNVYGKRTRPILRWAGSKRVMLPTLVSAAPKKYGRYFEPFCGSACLFLALAPADAVLGDLNKELIDTYRVLKTSVEAVYSVLSGYPQTREFYYEIRAKDTDVLSAVERAARFIYLNRHCFNGIYRTSKDGKFNVPLGSRTGAMPSRAVFESFSARLETAELRIGDFEKIVVDARRGDFVYLDPPYFSSRPTYGEYGYDTFRDVDLTRLIDLIRRLSRRGVYVLLSYGGSDDLASRLPRFSCLQVHTIRRLAAAKRFRRGVYDNLLANFEISARA